jgi:uncharacterized protein (DUF2147 family)
MAYFRGGMMAAALLGVAACGVALAQPASPAGQWVTASRNLVVTIGPCGAVLCGAVARVLANNSMMARGEAAAAPLPVGYRLISDLRRDGDHWRGRIFNRENGRSYDCTMRKLPDGALEVRPYIVMSLFGRTQIWTRAPD